MNSLKIQWKITSFLNFTKTGPTSHVSSESSTRTGPQTSVFDVLAVNPNMNFYTKLRKKSKEKKGNKAKAIKKKLMTAGELFIAGGLLTAGGNLVDSISGNDDSSPQISAGEVNWIEDKTKALFEIKTNARDSSSSSFPWGILGYVLLGLGMILMAIPAIRLIRWIKASCGGRSDSHKHEERNFEEPTNVRNSVKYYPDPEERLEYDSQPIPSLSQRQLMLEQEARTNIKDPSE